jgi:hypothetical protein
MKLSWFRRNLENILVGLIAVLFLALSSFFVSQVQEGDYIKFLSPDETANYFFAKNYAKTQDLAVFEQANLFGEEIVRPRSIRSDHGWLKPVSFLGIILLYGKIATYLGTWIIPYLSPIFASLGIVFFYALIKKLFGRQTGLIVALILATFPVYFFYTVRSMFHNVLFTVFLLGASYFIVICLPDRQKIKKKFFNFSLSYKQILSYLWALLAGIFLGGAAGARSSELLWLLPVLFIAWLFYVRRLGFTRLVLVVAGFILALLPVFYWNQILYSSPFYGGYGEMNTSIQEMSAAGGKILHTNLSKESFSRYREAFNVILDNVFYFGYHPRQSLDMFYYYVMVMFPLLCVLTFFGFFIFVVQAFRKIKRGPILYLLVWFVLSSILVLYYGSWQFYDNPDPSRFTIGNSYTRYWLPMYIMAMPLAALFIVSLAKAISKTVKLKEALPSRERLRKMLYFLVAALISGIWIFSSSIFVLFGSEEGLMTLYYNHFRDKENAQAILELTEDNAIIITQYHDKQLFPERKIISALLTSNEINEVLGKLLNHYPLYYYNFAFPEKDLTYLNERKLPPFGFNIELIERRGPFGLYSLYPLDSSMDDNEDNIVSDDVEEEKNDNSNTEEQVELE